MAAWHAALGVGLFLTFTYVVIPYGATASLVYVFSTALAAAAIWTAVWRRHEHIPARPWALIATALTLATAGHAVWYWLDLQGLEPFPSLADAFYLAIYPLFMIALWKMGRSAKNNRGALSDALIVAISAGVLAWALLIAPYAQDPELTWGQLLVSTGYPVADLLVLPLMLRFVFIQRMRITTHLLLMAGMLSYLAADVLYAHGNITGWYQPGGLTDSLWLVAYALFAAAVWHPSAAVTPFPQTNSKALSRHRLLVLTLAAVLVPTLILFTQGHDTATTRVAAIASIALFLLVLSRMDSLLQETHRQAEALEHLARTDPLTGAANRRHLDEFLTAEIERANRHGHPLSLALLDLDHFKNFNDTHGHAAGDALLREMVQAWRRELRQSDLLARYGGEEFVVVLPNTGTEQCREALERLRRCIPFGQTCSAGYSLYVDGDGPETLIRRADQALYRAKNAGRDRIVYQSE